MLLIIMDFIEQNWAAFVQHCKGHGLTDEKDISTEIEKILLREVKGERKE